MVLDNTQDDDVFLQSRASGDCRRAVTNKLGMLRVVQPINAECNSILHWRFAQFPEEANVSTKWPQ
jgi:hypothetical protein